MPGDQQHEGHAHHGLVVHATGAALPVQQPAEHVVAGTALLVGDHHVEKIADLPGAAGAFVGRRAPAEHQRRTALEELVLAVGHAEYLTDHL